MGDMAPPAPLLQITIIGAGIAGLTCALALRHTNPSARVTLLEKSGFHAHKETGAAMYVAPNCSDHLLRMGWKAEKSGSNKCLGFTSIDGPTGKVKNKADLSFADEKWRGADGRDRPWLLVHRVDFHRELKRMVLDETGEVPGSPPILHLGITIQDIDARTGLVKLTDGRTFGSDVVIGADGNSSTTRRYIAPNAVLKPYGKACYRFLVPRQTLLDDPETRLFAENEGYNSEVKGPDRRLFIYPCRENTMINCGVFAPEDDPTATTMADEDWDREASKERMLESFQSFDASARKLLEYAGDDLKVWQLVDMDHLERWNKGRICLIGDAAHPFLPFLGNGAAQAMEDAVSLATLLGSGSTSDEVPDLLELLDEIRRERVDFLVEGARKNGLDADKGAPSPTYLMEMLDFIYRHDEWTNTTERLKEWREKTTRMRT